MELFLSCSFIAGYHLGELIKIIIIFIIIIIIITRFFGSQISKVVLKTSFDICFAIIFNMPHQP